MRFRPWIPIVALAFPGGAAAAAVACTSASIDPPQPLERRAPDYPDGARQLGLEGVVEVELTVLADGRTAWTRVLRADPPGLFEDAALAAVRDWRFAPARRNGEPVECRSSARLRFLMIDEIVPGEARLDGEGRPFPRYPDAARESGLEGQVRVEYEVGPDGAVRGVDVLESIPRGAFDAAVVATLSSWRYPADAAPQGLTARQFAFRLPRYPPPPEAAVGGGARYPAALCDTRPRGRVRLDVEVAADGRVTAARIASADPPGVFDTHALRVALALRRTPARRQGAPIAAPARLTFDYDPDVGCADGDGPRPASRRRPPRVGGLALPAPDARVASAETEGLADAAERAGPGPERREQQ